MKDKDLQFEILKINYFTFGGIGNKITFKEINDNMIMKRVFPKNSLKDKNALKEEMVSFYKSAKLIEEINKIEEISVGDII